MVILWSNSMIPPYSCFHYSVVVFNDSIIHLFSLCSFCHLIPSYNCFHYGHSVVILWSNSIPSYSVLGSAPWTRSVPTVRFDLTSFKKDTTDLETYKQFYLKLVPEFPSSERTFSLTAQRQTQELLTRQYPPNVSDNRTHVFRTTVQYILQSFELPF